MKGLKFCITPQSDLRSLENDISSFSRRLRLNEFFHGKDISVDENDGSLVKNLSTFTPMQGRNSTLDNVINILKNTSLSTVHARDNISKEQREALNKLASCQDVIIKQADKGGALVIMNRQATLHNHVQNHTIV